MNLAGIAQLAVKGAKTAGNTVIFFGKAHVPELLIGGGLLGFGATVYGACRATNTAHDILEQKEEQLARNEEQFHEGHKSQDGYERGIRIINRETKVGLIKAYTPVATMGIASVILILGGYRVINGRFVAAAAAYKTLESGFERYRGNVISEFGKEVDWRMMHGMTEEEAEQRKRIIEDQEKLPEGKKPTAKETALALKRRNEGYNRIFDQYSDKWKRYWTPEQFLDFVRFKVNQLQDKLVLQGYLFLNDLYEAYGLEKTSEGQLVGWLWRKNHHPKIGVGLDEMPEEELRRILGTRRNEDLMMWLTPNPDGIIYNLIDKPDPELMATYG